MDENEIKYPFFISDDGYINLRLKVLTKDEEEKEKLVAELLGMGHHGKKFELSVDKVIINQIYFYNQNPLTKLRYIKEEVLKNITEMFDSAINMES